MEALSFMKFWLSNGRTRRETRISDAVAGSSAALDGTVTEVELAEGDDSFFELELSLSDFSLKDKKPPEETAKPDRTGATTTTTTPCSVSSTDYFSKNKVIPVETGPKPHSPIALLKSGTKFRAFSFKKPKPVESEKSTPRYEKKESSKSLNVRFRIEDGNNETSFRTASAITRPVSEGVASSVSSSSSRRFFSLMKPLYAMTSKKQSTKENGVSVTSSSPASSPAMEKQRSNVAAGIRIVRRHLGKSRSASLAVGAMSPANRVDESLQIQQDGIQSAILHCKRSFHGSRESSLLSRSTSDSSSQEKLSTSSSEDSYIFSRIASDSMSEKSIESQRINVP